MVKKEIVVLAVLVLLGLYLRSYHVDYPVIGYHNWKETHYLTEARNFARDGFFEHGFFVPEVDYPRLGRDPSGAHPDTFPMISVLASIGFMLFGISVGVARWVGILFNTGVIVMMYLVAKKLFNREDFALVTALLTAVLPLYIFFSHNVQLMNPGLFFMVSSLYFYLGWRESFGKSDMILTVLFFTLATITKYPFAVISIPMFIMLPFRKIPEIVRNNISTLVVCFLIMLAGPAWFMYSENVLTEKFGGEGAVSGDIIDPGVMLTEKWQTTQRLYMVDNYTETGFAIALLGMVLILIGIFIIRKRGFGERFILAYLVASIMFVVVVSYKIGGHSYHHYPIAPFIILCISYFITKASDGFSKIKIEGRDIPYVHLIVILVFGILLYSPIQDSINRQFDTQFIGLDVAGEYIKENSNEDELVFFPSHQSYGVLWHADRKGYATPNNLEDFKEIESHGATWLFVYQWGFTIMDNEEMWGYIKNNYSVRQVAFVNTDSGSKLIYVLLERGGSFDDDDLVNVDVSKVQVREYDLTRGLTGLYYLTYSQRKY